MLKRIMKRNTVSLVSFIIISFTFILTTCVENHLLPNFGTIFLTSDPIGAEIYLNGKNTGKVTPDSLMELLSGEQIVTLKFTEFSDSTFVIELNENEALNFYITLIESNPDGEIVVTSEPSGAAISVNDINTGEITPATFSNLERGLYKFKLTLDLFEDISFEINLQKDEKVDRNIKMIIAGTSGSLLVSSDPSGAQIFLDDIYTEKTTPDTVKPMAPGNYQIKLSLTGFIDTTFSTTISTGILTSEYIFLKESDPQGEITLTSEPSGAAIIINNDSTGKTTPATFSNLKRGKYSIKLSLNLYEDINFNIELSKDQKVNKNTKMIIAGSSGSLYITSSPSGAKLFLDDVNTGKITPDTLNPVAPGDHTIKLSLTDFRDTTITTTVSSSTLTTENVILTLYEPRGSISLESNPSGARIYLDDVDQELFTPNTLTKLEAGNYQIKLELAEYNDSVFTVPVLADQETTWPLINLVKIPYNISVSINPNEGGTVLGSGGYDEGEEVTLIATPAFGYNFVSWTENDQVQSTNSQYTFTADSDRNLVANFKLKVYNITAAAYPESGGIINGSGQYTHGDLVELTASTQNGYRFVNWTENSIEVHTSESYTFAATSNRDLIANFDPIGTLIVNSDPIGADIYLNSGYSGQQTPHNFEDILAGEYSVTLKLDDFADTTLVDTVFPGQTTNLDNVYLRDITPNIEVVITYEVKTNGRLFFYFVFNQDIRFDRVEIQSPNGIDFIQHYSGSLLYQGIAQDWSYAEKIVGEWSFTFYGRKVGGRQSEFTVNKTHQVN